MMRNEHEISRHSPNQLLVLGRWQLRDWLSWRGCWLTQSSCVALQHSKLGFLCQVSWWKCWRRTRIEGTTTVVLVVVGYQDWVGDCDWSQYGKGSTSVCLVCIEPWAWKDNWFWGILIPLSGPLNCQVNRRGDTYNYRTVFWEGKIGQLRWCSHVEERSSWHSYSLIQASVQVV